VKPISLGIVGIGKIARDQHLPAIAGNGAFTLAAAASRNGKVDGVASFPTLEAMLDGCPALDAVSLCMPPAVRYEAARLALSKGKHVMMEKPPCLSTLQLTHLVELAKEAGLTLYQTWHSQHAPGVAKARRLLAERRLTGIKVAWKENVRQWHPGQGWIFDATGFGVFDPGINALSILTRILPEPFFPISAHLSIPSNRQAPIAAEVSFVTAGGAPIEAEFDFLQTGHQTWDIEIDTAQGPLKLSEGGAVLSVDGKVDAAEGDALVGEYPSLYRDFAKLVREGRSEVDARPLQLIADINLMAERTQVEPFIE
jgi:predicted dehydrogenase